MAKFVESYRFLTLSNSEDWNISSGRNSGEVLIIHNDNKCVDLIEINTQQKIRCGNLKQKQHYRFTSPVVYEDGFYSAILNKHILLRWGDEYWREITESGENVDLRKGSISINVANPLYTLVRGFPGDPILVFESGDVILWSKLIQDPNSTRPQLFSSDHCITQIETFHNESSCIVACLTTNKNNSVVTVHLTSISRKELEATYKGSHSLDSKIVLESRLVRTKEGIMVLSVCEDLKIYGLDLDLIQDLEPGTVGNPIINVPLVRSGGSISATALSPQLVLLTGVQGLGHQPESNCIIVDLKYGVTSGEFLERCNEVRTLPGCNFVFGVNGNEVKATRYTLSDSSLASVLGLFQNSDSNTPKPSKTEDELLEVLPTEFGKPIRENYGKSSSLISSKILNDLLKRKDIVLINSALNMFDSVPEESLLRVLLFFLSADNAVFPQQEKLTRSNGIKSQQLTRTDCVNLILKMPIDGPRLREELRQITFEQAKLILNYLNDLVPRVPVNGTSGGPTLWQVLEWGNMLLDAHYHNLIVFNNTDTLMSLVSQITQSLSTISEMDQTSSLIRKALKPYRKNVINARRSTFYTVTRHRIE